MSKLKKILICFIVISACVLYVPGAIFMLGEMREYPQDKEFVMAGTDKVGTWLYGPPIYTVFVVPGLICRYFWSES